MIDFVLLLLAVVVLGPFILLGIAWLLIGGLGLVLAGIEWCMDKWVERA